MGYIVWRDMGYEGWLKSDELETLEECFKYLKDYNMGNSYLITKVVKVSFVEVEEKT